MSPPEVWKGWSWVDHCSLPPECPSKASPGQRRKNNCLSRGGRAAFSAPLRRSGGAALSGLHPPSPSSPPLGEFLLLVLFYPRVGAARCTSSSVLRLLGSRDPWPSHGAPAAVDEFRCHQGFSPDLGTERSNTRTRSCPF